MKSTTQRLKELQKKLFALNYAESLIHIDRATVAPTASEESRGEALGVLASYRHALTASEETALLLEEALADDTLDAHTKREAVLLARDREYTAAIPEEDYVAYCRLLNRAEGAWARAKEENDYASFAPILGEIFDTTAAFAKAYRPEDDPYDTRLSLYERGLTKKKCEVFFTEIKKSITPLLKSVAAAPKIDASALSLHYPIEQQRELAHLLLETMGITHEHATLSESEHPFTQDLCCDDVRLTTHYYENDLTSYFSVIHEGGHALYELFGGEEHRYTAVSGGASMGMHESQSRLYENIIGRSRPFTSFLFPHLERLFPTQLKGVDAETFYRMINKVTPSLVRVDADEMTYSYHIMVRYEVEKAMLEKSITAREIPTLWHDLYRDYLGIEVPNDTLGCLQDVHWSGGDIGYFPSYALGSAYGAHIFARLKQEVPADEAMAKGDLTPITAWLAEKIFRHSSLLDPEELLQSVLGEPFDPRHYTAYLTEKYSEIYGL